jgi:dTDP-glucose 4,6-dehydratase
MKTLLVTGGAGFIGGNFVLGLLEDAEHECKVVNLDVLSYAGNMDTLSSLMDNPRHVFVEGNICDRKLIRKLLAEHRPSAVVNFAAESHVDRSIDAPGDFIQTNIVGTFELLDASRDYWNGLTGDDKQNFRFLHVSTDEVYGSLGKTGLFTEETPYAPNSPYSASKASADHLVRAYYHTYGLPVLTTNCSNNYGRYQFPEKLIPLMVQKAVNGESIPIYGDGQQIRDWLFVGDHCQAIMRVLAEGEPGEVYNIGGNSEMANLDVAHHVCELMDELLPDSAHKPHKSLITFVKDRPGHDRRYAIDASKIRQTLAWEPQETFASGIRKTVKWYLENEEWVTRAQSGDYRGERLGLGTKEK